MKSCFNWLCRYCAKDYFPFIGNKSILKEETKNLKDEYFSYYKYKLRDNMIAKFIIYEYLLALIGNDLYVLMEYYDEVWWNWMWLDDVVRWCDVVTIRWCDENFWCCNEIMWSDV